MPNKTAAAVNKNTEGSDGRLFEVAPIDENKSLSFLYNVGYSCIACMHVVYIICMHVLCVGYICMHDYYILLDLYIYTSQNNQNGSFQEIIRLCGIERKALLPSFLPT